MHDASPSPQPAPTAAILPDGSAFFTASLPLPADHWLYAPACAEWDSERDTTADTPQPILTHAQRDAVVAAVRYAIRGATMLGQEKGFDPDALVQNAVYALCGPFGRTSSSAPAATQAQAEPVAWMAFAALDGRPLALPEYAAADAPGVMGKVLDAARKEGFRGTGKERMQQLGWWAAPVHLQSAPVGDGEASQAARIADLEAAAHYYRAGLLRIRPEWVPARIRLARAVFGDAPFRGAGAAVGDHDCECNQWGAVSVIDRSGAALGLRPAEFEVVAWKRAAQAKGGA